MPSNETMLNDLKRFLVDHLFIEMPVEEIRADMGLATDIGVDSLGFTELMAHLEDAYGIRISQDEFVPENFRNLDAVMNLVALKLSVAA